VGEQFAQGLAQGQASVLSALICTFKGRPFTSDPWLLGLASTPALHGRLELDGWG
jgi:hypothetical protein